MRTVCELYQQAPPLQEQGTHLMSTDEKTGSQALERATPSRPLRPGLVAWQEFEYIRHGTQTLIATCAVATGQVVAPTVGPTRTEADFAAHIEQTLQTNPQASWIFLVDQLNTPQSETLVRLVAQHCELEDDLGVKGETGI